MKCKAIECSISKAGGYTTVKDCAYKARVLFKIAFQGSAEPFIIGFCSEHAENLDTDFRTWLKKFSFRHGSSGSSGLSIRSVAVYTFSEKTLIERSSEKELSSLKDERRNRDAILRLKDTIRLKTFKSISQELWKEILETAMQELLAEEVMKS